MERRLARQEQDLELYKAILRAGVGMKAPRVADVLASEKGQRIVRKWELKYLRAGPASVAGAQHLPPRPS